MLQQLLSLSQNGWVGLQKSKTLTSPHLLYDAGAKWSFYQSNIFWLKHSRDGHFIEGLAALLYLNHDVNILVILQQTEIGIKVKLVVPDVGVSQDHLALPEGLEEDLLPLCPLIRQQLPLKRTKQLKVIYVKTVTASRKPWKNVSNKTNNAAAIRVYHTLHEPDGKPL